MKFKDYADLIMIGQKDVKIDISPIVESMTKENLNVLIRGPSGYGKTFLACIIVSYLTSKKENTFWYHVGENIFLNPEVRINVIDEIHLLKEPEFLYPIMDSKNYSFILLTNEFDKLKDPLVRRCFEFTLSPYSRNEIKEIIEQELMKENIADNRVLEIIDKYSKDSPRDSIMLTRKSILFLKGDSIENLENYLLNSGLTSGGFSRMDREYLNLLENNKYLGIETLVNLLSVPKDIIRGEIEPFLIRKGRIKISSRGRTLCY